MNDKNTKKSHSRYGRILFLGRSSSPCCCLFFFTALKCTTWSRQCERKSTMWTEPNGFKRQSHLRTLCAMAVSMSAGEVNGDAHLSGASAWSRCRRLAWLVSLYCGPGHGPANKLNRGAGETLHTRQLLLIYRARRQRGAENRIETLELARRDTCTGNNHHCWPAIPQYWRHRWIIHWPLMRY